MPMPESDLHYFLEVSLAHLNKLTNHELVQQDATIEFQSLVFSAYTGLLHLSGSAEGFVYLTASQQLLQHLYTARHSRSRLAEENCRDVMSEITGTLAQQVRQHFGPSLHLSEPRIFSTVPDDPIEMPSAVFVQPIVWRREHAFFVLGLSTPETT